MAKMRGLSMLRACGGLLALACAFGCAGCLAPPRLPADRAFALSASALAGSDRYSFDGELTVLGPGGTALLRRPFRGEVAGHRLAALSWSGSPPRTLAGASHPLSLAETAPLRAAALSYEPAASGAVSFKVALRPDAARDRMAGMLRAELEAVRRELAPRIAGAERANPAAAAEARKRWQAASERLAAALGTLRATTVCTWTADRRSWFPTELREETVLRYTLGGREWSERRVSVTHFRRRPDNAIMKREEGRP